MKDKTTEKVERVKEFLDSQGLFYTDRGNGLLTIDNINLWCTTETFWDTRNNHKGKGINAFMLYLKNVCRQNIIRRDSI